MIFLCWLGTVVHLHAIVIYLPKSTMGTPEQYVRSVQVKSKDTRTTLLTFLLTCNRFYTLLWCFHCLLWTSKCRLRKVYIKGFSVLSVLIVLCELDVTYDLLGFHDIFFLSRKLYRISSLRIAQELRLLFKTNYLRKHFSGSTA